MPHSIRKSFVAGVSAAALALLVGGCTNYSSDLTPELQSYAATAEQDRNRQARVIDNNSRQVWDDLSRVLLFEETSQLSRYPVP